jgi:hypothetical protein
MVPSAIQDSEEAIMSGDPEFSRRDFLKGLAAVAGTEGALELPSAGFHLHKEAVRLAMEYLADEITGLPNDKIGTLAVLENTVDGYRSGKFRHHPLAGSAEVDPQDMATALEDAAKLIRSGWKPPQWWYDFTRQRALRFFGSGALEDLSSDLESGSASKAPLTSHETKNMPPERAPAVPTIPLVEHIDELRAELRGSLDRGERETIATETETSRRTLKEQEHADELAAAQLGPKPEQQVRSTLDRDAAKLEAQTLVVPPHRQAEGNRSRHTLAILSEDTRGKDYPGRDLDAAAARLSTETGLRYTPAVGGEFVAGIYRQSLRLTSGRYAMIDSGLGFALVPWTTELDRHLGRHVTGVAKESGGIDWSFGRKRGLEI